MPTPNTRINLLGSVFDRLVGPEDANPAKASGLASLDDDEYLLAFIRRDVEALLNARQSPSPIGQEFVETRNSVASYGIPDLDAMSAATARDREAICKLIRDAVVTHESRLRDVHVRSLDPEDDDIGSCRFVIEARLESAGRLPVEFSTEVEFSTGKSKVRESGRQA